MTTSTRGSVDRALADLVGGWSGGETLYELACARLARIAAELAAEPARFTLHAAAARMSATVAALYVERDGVYSGLPDVDVWDESRDARLYAGPWPVVAHPPCASWCRLAGFREDRFGYKRGEDGGCFEAALRAVHEWGGVIEHPAYSDAWKAHGLPRPNVREGWTLGLDGGASCYVEQGRYGLPVKKATWLYAFGVDLPELRWGFAADREGDDIGGMDAWRDRFGGRRSQWEHSPQSEYWRNGATSTPHLGKTATTPPAFRDVLLDMARSAAAVPEERG